MHEFKICYPLGSGNANEKLYLAPHRLPKDKPINLKWDNTDNLRFEYSYTFMPKGMLTRFIVERYKNIHEGMQWFYGVLLKVNNILALIQEDYFNLKATIHLDGENKRDVLTKICDTFESIHNDFSNLVLEVESVL